MHGHVSKAGDVFAYAVLLHELITGRRAYTGDQCLVKCWRSATPAAWVEWLRAPFRASTNCVWQQHLFNRAPALANVHASGSPSTNRGSVPVQDIGECTNAMLVWPAGVHRWADACPTFIMHAIS